MNTDQLQSYHEQQIKEYRNESINNVSQNRGKRDVNQLTDYSYNVNMYEEIRHYYNTEKYTVFPQFIHNTCGKVSFNSGKG
jgi:hypothetical protein